MRGKARDRKGEGGVRGLDTPARLDMRLSVDDNTRICYIRARWAKHEACKRVRNVLLDKGVRDSMQSVVYMLSMCLLQFFCCSVFFNHSIRFFLVVRFEEQSQKIVCINEIPVNFTK